MWRCRSRAAGVRCAPASPTARSASACGRSPAITTRATPPTRRGRRARSRSSCLHPLRVRRSVVGPVSLFEAAKTGDLDALRAADLSARQPPYDWTLLHVAAANGQLAAVDLLLERGLDVNARERGDNTYAMHWAAAGGHLQVVERLADAGGDVVGAGDDHRLEVIGWATCWDSCQDAV